MPENSHSGMDTSYMILCNNQFFFHQNASVHITVSVALLRNGWAPTMNSLNQVGPAGIEKERSLTKRVAMKRLRPEAGQRPYGRGYWLKLGFHEPKMLSTV